MPISGKIRMLVITDGHVRTKPLQYGLMDCEVNGSMLATGDFLAVSDNLDDCINAVPNGFTGCENPLINLIFDGKAQGLFIEERHLH